MPKGENVKTQQFKVLSLIEAISESNSNICYPANISWSKEMLTVSSKHLDPSYTIEVTQLFEYFLCQPW